MANGIINRHKLVYPTLFVTLIFAYGSLMSYCYYQQPVMTIQAGAVVADSSDPPRIEGSFTISVPPTGLAPGAARSQGTGGACLLANAAGFPRDAVTEANKVPMGSLPESCSSNSQCSDPFSIAQPKSDWTGYCVEGSCWVRPGPAADYCVRSADRNNQPWAVGSHAFPEAPAESLAKPGQPINWRVHACLNAFELFSMKDNKACGMGGVRLLHDGPVENVTKLGEQP